MGDVVAVAAALRDAAPRDGILAAEPTYSLARDAVVAGDPVTVGTRKLAARPLEAVQGARGRARRIDTPFVGREPELAALRDALGRTTAERRCVAVTVFGDAGIGKTRLAEELASSLVRGRVLTTRCVPYGEGSTFLPVIDLVHQAAGAATEEALARLVPDDEDGRLAARQLAALADQAATVPRGEAFWAVRVLLESLARDDPLVVVLDDLHWAEPALLDLVEYLVERLAAPVVLICLARPELLDGRPGWAGAASGVGLLRLGPLGQDEAQALLEGLGEGEVDERVRRRIVERAEGNALHLEQLLAFVADEGGDPALEDVPQTVEAVLASRVDRLSADARDTLQRAAVAGRELTRGIVVALSEPGAPVDAALLELTRRGLLHPEPADGPDDGYSIHHALLRDVAYASLPKAVRASLHERASAWLDRNGSGPDELVGWHLEQACRYRSELQPADPELPALAEAAGQRLSSAGIRATQAADASAVALLRRAADLLPDDARRAAVLLELGPWLRTVGDPTAASEAFAEALRLADAVSAEPLLARARVEIAWDEAALRTRLPMTALGELILEVMPSIEAAGDDRGLMRAWQFLGTTRLYDEQMEALEHAARNARAHAGRAGWLPINAVATVATALVHGPTPVERARSELAALMHEFRDSRNVWAAIAGSAAVIHTMATADEIATDLMTTSRELLAEYDDRLRITTAWMPNQLSILRLRGDAHSARALLGEWREQLTATGDNAYLSTALVQLADLTVDDPSAETDLLLEEASQRASADDRLVQALLRSVSAKRLALRGDLDEAQRLIAEAAVVLRESDALGDRARIELDRARVLELSGDDDGAGAALAEARRLFQAKGNTRALLAVDTAGAAALT